MTRRRLLAGLAVAGAAYAVIRIPWSRWTESETEKLVLELVGRIAVPDPLAVGAAYLRDHPHDPDLLLEVFDGLPLAGPETPGEAFGRRLREDFEEDRTVTADGWILALTEARFCALLVLDKSS